MSVFVVLCVLMPAVISAWEYYDEDYYYDGSDYYNGDSGRLPEPTGYVQYIKMS